ncbi:hypothetical protein HPB47_007515 [Ixodes persulcatus]|uniref:Uncharacterized protein n=1 Tax=Ixodes persulcatus TaxID=34615 RepID=A0AC60P7B0_IXOPE|nr:hypothetical protein HPB47_007515 [Ixodes persulcatus]
MEAKFRESDVPESNLEPVIIPLDASGTEEESGDDDEADDEDEGRLSHVLFSLSSKVPSSALSSSAVFCSC